MDDRRKSRFFRAIEHSRSKLQAFRKHRLEVIREYVGKHYSDDSAPDKVPVNLLELAINVYRRHLVSGMPQSLVTTKNPRLKRPRLKLELALNELHKQIHFGDTMATAAMDALISWAVVKVGQYAAGEVAVGGTRRRIGRPYCDLIDLDDWVHDVPAKHWDMMSYCGHRYRAPLETAKEDKTLQDRDKLRADATDELMEGEDQVSEVSRGQDKLDEGTFLDMVQLWDFWLPGDNVIITASLDTKVIHRTRDWEGPGEGPFYRLNLQDVPGQIVGLAPSLLWLDIHTAANILYRKLIRQSDRQKTVGGFRSGADRDADNVVKANDGEMLRMDDPNSVKEYRFGGVDNNNLAFAIHLADKFSWLAGNLDALGGLSAMSDTVGQDYMLQQRASERLKSLQGRVRNFVRQVSEALAWHLHTDPLLKIPLSRRVGNTEIPMEYGPQDRQGQLHDYTIDIEPYSLYDRTPQERLTMLTQVFQTFIAPFAPLMAEQGITVNYDGLLRQVGRLGNLPELEDIIIFGPKGEGGGGDVRSRMAPNTSRTYERVNRSASTRKGRDAEMMGQLLGAGRQQRGAT